MCISGICLFNKNTRDFTLIEKHSLIENIEDLRIFDYNDRVWFVGYKRNKAFIFETYIGYFDSDCQKIETVVGCIKLPESHIKNVTPLIHNNKLIFIDIFTGSVYNEGIINTLDKTLLYDVVSQYDDDDCLLVFGTTKYVHLYDTTYGGLVHIKNNKFNHMYYLYIWIEIDVATWRITFASQPYIIKKKGIVFVSHIEKVSDNTFELMFGEDDQYSWKCNTTLESLRCH
jgi:hypothetical protein